MRANICKEHGEGIDKAWLSKLNPHIDEATKKVELKAESALVKDWVRTQYGQILKHCFKQNDCTLDDIIT